MFNGQKISVATPIFNETFFLQGWLKCVAELADEIVVTDGGSSDGSINMLLNFHRTHHDLTMDLRYEPQEGFPYTDDCNEGTIRNDLLERCTGDFIVMLDADEIITREDMEIAIDALNAEDASRAMFKHIPFWGDFRHVRLSTEGDHRWFNVDVSRIIRNDGSCSYVDRPHHSPLQGKPVINTECRLYHCHYAFGAARLKVRDNRRFDFDPDNVPEEDQSNVFRPVVGLYDGPYPDGLLSMYPSE